MYEHRSEDIELPQYYDEDNEPKPQENDNEAEENKNKNIIIAIVVVIGVLVLGVIIFLIIFFSSKKKRKGGYISVVHVLELKDEISLFKVGNLNKDEYDIEVINDAISMRLLEESYSINKNIIKFNDKKIGTIECKIKFNTVLTSMDSMFKDIKSLIKADLSGFVSEKVKSMNSLFSNCEKLENINFTNFNSKKLEHMDNTFENCINLYELDLKSFQTPKLKSLISTFNNCSNLEYLDLSNFELKEMIVDRDGIFSNTKLQYIKVNDEETNNLMLKAIPNNNSSNNTSELKCFEGKNEICKTCNKDNNKCQSCNEGYYLPNYLTNIAKCKKCYESCKNCNDYMNCTECIDEKKYNLIVGHCIPTIIKDDNPTEVITQIITDISDQPTKDDLENKESESESGSD